ncbi:MAG: peroxiredoxin family protein [Cyclobacteriaceae bacterium]
MRISQLQLKIAALLPVMLLALSACSQNKPKEGNSITISGKVLNPQEGAITLVNLGDEDAPTDTIKLESDNTFKHTLNSKQPDFYRIDFFNKQMSMFIVSEYDLTIEADGSNRAGTFEVIGSPEMDDIKKLENIGRDFQASVIPLNDAFYQAQEAKDTKKMEEIQAEFFVMEKAQKNKVKDLMRNMEPSLALLSALVNFNMEDDFAFYDSITTLMDKEMPNSKYVAELKAQVDKERALAVGYEAPEITLPNPNGEMVSLSSLKGKVVLVDFWASWCRPCRVENPNVVRMYNKYNEKGFEILGVSLDRDKAAWLKAIDDDGLTWTHISDLKYFDSEAARIYNIQAIPFTILVDEEGKIISKNLRGEALEQKLAEIFN